MLNFRDYLNFAERYIRHAEEDGINSSNLEWLLIPSAILAWTAIESFVNNRFFDYGSLPDKKFELHERAFLLEKKIKFIDSGAKSGSFVLEGNEYKRLEDKIFFLISKFSSKKEEDLKGKSLWQNFQEFKTLRDNILHPRTDKDIEIDINKVKKHIDTSKRIIQLISEHLWSKKVEF
ncbi:hypothetical protein [Candidatus Oleimmundimicrobium sp.]|uniref:hypothetical protein n=1 Tax=Candidatus Oleimmundimicrobium sp. TaxID=3060597 RepID=UPI0027232536|nr:hypothetical protein [Candidatus Oleimmundimicrobium sp.]MDO8886690.1 hypothetical protein [Candidatus Oleimmundimicrobium sp.]